MNRGFMEKDIYMAKKHMKKSPVSLVLTKKNFNNIIS